MKLKKIVMHWDDGTEVPLEMDKYTMEEERGLVRQLTLGKFAPVGLKSNGQGRILIKGWKGCRDYDSFQANTEEWV